MWFALRKGIRAQLPYVSRRILIPVPAPREYPKHALQGTSRPQKQGRRLQYLFPTATGNEIYFYIENRIRAVFEAQLAAGISYLGKRIDGLEKPDMMVIELDPEKEWTLGR
jgi:hypothetical protein